MNSLKRRNLNVLMTLTGLVAGMIGMAYASVPLYRLFCEKTGFDGTTQRAASAPGEVLDRSVTVTFSADVSGDLPWKFYPAQKNVEAKIGQPNTAIFIAENLSDRSVTGTATFNVSPDLYGPYFVKIQCFCFDQQTLKPGERVEMPVVFYLDPAMAKDPQLDRMSDVTLSYTFFKAAVQLDPAGQKIGTTQLDTVAPGDAGNKSVN
jgi:cytochrome c oxidase assembly protein subunit 11